MVINIFLHRNLGYMTHIIHRWHYKHRHDSSEDRPSYTSLRSTRLCKLSTCRYCYSTYYSDSYQGMQLSIYTHKSRYDNHSSYRSRSCNSCLYSYQDKKRGTSAHRIHFYMRNMCHLRHYMFYPDNFQDRFYGILNHKIHSCRSHTYHS